MKFLSQEETRAKINDFGRKREPFLLIIDSSLMRSVVLRLDEAIHENIFFNFNGITNKKEEAKDIPEMIFELFPIDFETYEKAFNRVCFHIKRGDTYLLNLTFPTKVRTNLSMAQIFSIAQAPYKLLFRDDFTVFSPEIFIRIRDGIISGFPMKGTIDAGIPDAEKIILEDKKELNEHNTIVDLIRNDISMVATRVMVPRFRYTDRIRTNRKELLQVSSEITGRLSGDFLSRLGDIIFTMLPAGSVTGAPKEKTVQIIKEAEPDDRGFYTGICAYFDGKSLDSAVMIRFIENNSNGTYFRSGGGITALSDPLSEYQEMIDKVYVPVV